MELHTLLLTGSFLLFASILLYVQVLLLLGLLRKMSDDSVACRHELMRVSGRMFTIFVLTVSVVLVIGAVSLLLI